MNNLKRPRLNQVFEHAKSTQLTTNTIFLWMVIINFMRSVYPPAGSMTMMLKRHQFLCRFHGASCFLYCKELWHPAKAKENLFGSLVTSYIKHSAFSDNKHQQVNMYRDEKERELTWKIVPHFFSALARFFRSSLDTLGSLSTWKRKHLTNYYPKLQLSLSFRMLNIVFSFVITCFS